MGDSVRVETRVFNTRDRRKGFDYDAHVAIENIKSGIYLNSPRRKVLILSRPAAN